MRKIEDKVRETYESNKEQIITVFLALQHQNFVLGNSLTNLVQQWPTLPPDMMKNIESLMFSQKNS